MKVEHRYVLDVDGETRRTVPRGKIIYIGCEEFEVWPWRCVDGYRCIQCYFMGKTRCAPRFWAYPEAKPPTPPGESKGSKYPIERHNPIFSLDVDLPNGNGILSDYLVAQPTEALNDGGFTEEITERIKTRESQLFRTPEPYRITDETCPKCGYQYSLPWGTKKGKQVYFCPRCGRSWTPSPFGIPSGMKDFVRKLRREGLSQNAIRLKVEEVYHKKICRRSIWLWTKGENKEAGGEERMVKLTYEKGVHKCRKCGSRAPLDEKEGVYRCVDCGHEEREQRAYYQFCEEHKREIIQDVLDNGPDKTREEWQMPLQVWRTLSDRWGLHLVWAAPGFYPRSENGHRKLPDFRHDWPDEIKLKWLDAYKAEMEMLKR